MRDEDQAAPDAPFYRPELDALRCLAFVCVFVRHTTSNDAAWWAKLGLGHAFATVAATASQAGAFGVYLFFVLSAYLITELLLREKARTGRVHLARFYLRRMLRIWPLYFGYIALACAVARVVGDGVDASLLPFALLFVANWSGIWRGAATPTLNHLWSISVEEQFYLVFPPVIAWASRRAVTTMGLAMIAVAVAAIPLGPPGWPYAFTSSTSCFAALGAGVVVGTTWSESVRVPRLVLVLASPACWYVAAALGLGSSSAASIAAILLVVAGAVALLLAVQGWRPGPVLRYLGKISYGLYVFHVLVIAIVERLVDKKAISLAWYPLILLVELAATVGISALSYRLLETPFLRIKHRFAVVPSRPM